MATFEDAVQGLQSGIRSVERLFRRAAPKDPVEAAAHARISAAVRELGTRVEAMLFEVEALEDAARIARFDRLLAGMERTRRLRLIARIEQLLGS